MTTDSDQIGQIYLGEEELKVRRIGHDAMMEQDAVRTHWVRSCAHLLDTNGKKIGVTGLLDTGAVVSVMPIKTWERMGFTREDLIPTNLRLVAANRGAIYVAGRTPITVFHMGGRDLWMSFLVVENLDDADQLILGKDFVRNFDVMIDFNNGRIRTLNRNAEAFSKQKADIGCCNFVEHEIELEEGAVPHIEGARRMTPHKSEACRAEIEMLLEYDMIEPSKSPWACGVVLAKKKGGS